MKYFKNTELARLYHVSEKSVRNWIDAAEAGKLELQLHEERGRSYIANVTKNTAIIEKLVERGKKFKNTRGVKTIRPTQSFYDLYSTKQIMDIIASLTIHRETPLQYTYVDGGAEDWDKYAKRLVEEDAPNILNSTTKMIETTAENIDQLLGGRKKINVVDLGPGNGMPIKTVLERLVRQKRLGRYIPIDISQDMLTILEKNIKEWFGDSVAIESHLRDISYERFGDILATDFSDDDSVNLVFLLGGTLANFRSPEQTLQTINHSMGEDDILMIGSYMDTPKTRRYFDYYTTDRKVPVQDGLILDLLNIEESLYEVEQLFNEEKRARSISIRPTIDLRIEFELPGGMRQVELRKHEPILIWRHWHKNIVEVLTQLDQNDFDIMQSTKSPDGQYLLTAVKIKTGINI